MPDFRLNGCRIKVSPLRKKAERERETDAKNFVWSGNGEREREQWRWVFVRSALLGEPFDSVVFGIFWSRAFPSFFPVVILCHIFNLLFFFMGGDNVHVFVMYNILTTTNITSYLIFYHYYHSHLIKLFLDN